jgi:hypothetical protein
MADIRHRHVELHRLADEAWRGTASSPSVSSSAGADSDDTDGEDVGRTARDAPDMGLSAPSPAGDAYLLGVPMESARTSETQ